MIYFDNPKGSSLDFAIENHSKQNDFHWQISADKEIIQQADVKISLGETKTIPVSLSPTELVGKKIEVIVNAGEEKKEIYKSF